MTLPRRRSSPRTPWIGPLAGWELFRLARSGQSHRGRLLVVYLLLVAFILTPILWFEHVDPTVLFLGPPAILHRSDAAAFANRFVLVLLESVLLAVAAMTPGYAAATIADEKERGTLALLLTTVLSDREIVLGKAMGRLVFVLAAAVAGLPVVAGIAILGGVDVWFVLTGFALAGGTAALATAIGVHASCASDDLRGAMVRAYGFAALFIGGAFIPPCVLASPFYVLVLVESVPDGLIAFLLAGFGYPALQVAVATGLLADATRRLRHGREKYVPRPTPPEKVARLGEPLVERPQLVDWWPEPDLRDVDDRRRVSSADISRIDLPPIQDMDPLLWKERYVTGRTVDESSKTASRLAVAAFGGLGAVLLAIGAWNLLERLIEPTGLPDEGGREVMTAGTMFAGVYLFPAAVGLASAIARERRRQTLDPLLALPPSRRTILRIKVRAAIERGWWWVIPAVLAAGVSFGADGGWPLGVAAAAAVATGMALVIGLGSWLTVKSSSETKAFRFLVPAVVVVVGLPVLVWNASDWSHPELPAVGLAAASTMFAVAAIVLWRRAGRELERG